MRRTLIALGMFVPALAMIPARAGAADKAAATAVIIPTEGNQVHGTVKFSEEGGKTTVAVKVSGLSPGKHGFHVHEFGDCSSADGAASGGHYAFEKSDHGSPDDPKHHTGDLGNVVANDKGEVDTTITDAKIHLEGPSSVVGRAVIFHKGIDDLKSQPAGNSGPRVGCGVIGLAKVG